MPSKLVTDRQKSAEAVAAVGKTQAEAVAAALAERLKKHLLPGESMPDVAMLCVLLARELGAAKDGMVAADQAHGAELGEDREAREARDLAAQELRDRIVEVREMIAGLFGSASATRIVKGETPHDAVVLARFAGEMADALGKATLPEPRIPGAVLDLDRIAADLEAQRHAIDQRVTETARETRETQATLESKNRAIGDYDNTFTAIAGTYEGLLRIAGKDELASKIRPSRGRPGRTDQEPATEPDPT